MPDPDRPHRVLYVIACGGRPAGDLPAFVEEAQANGWEVCVVATPSALKFMDLDHLANLTGHVVRYDYKQPDEPDVLPPPDAIVVAPATFNTVNKWAAGISDTLALGILNEALGLGLPVIAVPFPNIALARHPAFRRSMADLEALGVRLLFDPEAHPLPTPNLGPASRDLFLAGPARGIRQARGAVGADARASTAVNGRQVPPALAGLHRMRRHASPLGRWVTTSEDRVHTEERLDAGRAEHQHHPARGRTRQPRRRQADTPWPKPPVGLASRPHSPTRPRTAASCRCAA